MFASLADAYRRAGELQEAWALLEEGLDEHPDFTTGHLVAARVLRDRGDAEEAEERYDRVLDLDPENTAALREKAALVQDRGRIEEALSLCQRLALLEPTDADLRARIRTLKEAHFRVGEVEPSGETGGAAGADEAEERQEAPEPGPGDEGEADEELEEAEGLEEAVRVEEIGLEAEPPDEVEVAAGWPEAEETGEAEEEDEPEEPEVFTRTMADLYARQGHADRALRIYERLLERDPENEDLRDRIRELKQEDEGAPADESTIASYFESLLEWESRA